MTSKPWTDKEIHRFNKRCDTLMAYGLSEFEAEYTAEILLRRDRPESGDDRRLCLECANLRRDCVCGARPSVSPVRKFEPCVTVLWRCDGFRK